MGHSAVCDGKLLSVDHSESHTVMSGTLCGWVKSACSEVRPMEPAFWLLGSMWSSGKFPELHWTSKSPLLNGVRDRPSMCRV